MEYRNKIFQIAGLLTFLKIDGFISGEEYDILIKLIKQHIDSLVNVDSRPSDIL